MLAAVALLLGEQTGGPRYWLRELLPTPFIPYTFLSLGTLIPIVNPRVADRLLMGWDERLLGLELQAALYSIPLPSLVGRPAQPRLLLVLLPAPGDWS